MAWCDNCRQYGASYAISYHDCALCCVKLLTALDAGNLPLAYLCV
jgi:hypothetical protein